MPFDQQGFLPEQEVELEPWRKVLLDAAKIMRSRGIAKGVRIDDAGRVCANGALAMAVGLPADVEQRLDRKDWPALEAAYDAMRKALGVYRLAPWNNDPSRTAEEVASVMELVARERRGV